MASMQSVRREDIRLGEPLPYSIYDKSGMLLLRAGFRINLPRQVEVLLRNGVFHSSEDPRFTPTPQRIEAEAEDTFETLDLLKIRLQRMFDQFRGTRVPDELLARIEDVALTVQEACTHDTNAALANLHLDYESSYVVVHHMQAAILCELIGKKLGVRDEQRLGLIQAALTHDLGLIDIQDALDRQIAPLSPEQQVRIRAHPSDGAQLLRALGVNDAMWLDAVAHHHERMDASGYPDALTGEQIAIPSRVLAVADIYSAMVRDRPYRKAMVSKEAMRNLLINQGAKTDQRLIQMMIKEVGVFPPGAIVKLANGEIAVVKQRLENSTFPIVYAFVRADGTPMMMPLQRDTSNAVHHIEGMVPFSDYKGCISLIRGLWIKTLY